MVSTSKKLFAVALIALVALMCAPAVVAQVAVGVTQQGWGVYPPATPVTNIQDEFCGNTPGTTTTVGQYGWDLTQIVGTTSAAAAVASVANHPCLITLTTQAAAGDGIYLSLGHGVGTLFPGNSAGWSSEHILEINQIATGSYRVGFGTVDSTSAIPTNGIYFRFLNGTDTYINVCADVSGSETCTATTVTPTAADYVDFSMVSNTAGTVTFTVKDVTTPASSTVTISTGLPTGVLSPMVDVVETGSSVADVYTVDYFGYQQAVTR